MFSEIYFHWYWRLTCSSIKRVTDLKGNVHGGEPHWSQLNKLTLLLPVTKNCDDTIIGMKFLFINGEKFDLQKKETT